MPPASSFSIQDAHRPDAHELQYRVLLVEDNPGDADLVREYLWDYANVTQSSTLTEAIALSRNSLFDVALVDSSLPDAEGAASIEALGALGSFPVVLLTGRDSSELGRAAAESGAQDYLLKGQFKAAQLRRAISSAVFRHEVIIQYRILLNESPDAIFIVGADGAVLAANLAASRAFGVEPHKLIGESLGIPLAGKDGCEIVLQNNNVMEMRVCRVPWRREMAYLAIFRDVTERTRLVAELSEASQKFSRLSKIDPLTGLLNRRGIEDALHKLAQSSSRGGGRAVAMLFDCDDFKAINTLGGYSAGDATLQLVANTLTQRMRAPLAFVGRIGGDEFLALLTETRFAESVLVAERLRDDIGRSPLPLAVPGLTRVSVSVGVAAIPSDCSSLKEVIELAEAALLSSKNNGKDRVSVRESQHELPALALASVEEIVRTPSMIRMAKQGIFHHPSGTLVGHELLFRGPDGSPFESPSMFFAAARQQNILAGADRASIRRACEAARSLAGIPRIHLNVFPSTLLDTSVEEIVDLCSAIDGMVLELSEQEFVGDPGLLLPAIAKIRKAGIRIALDDVGFGRSSLETVLVLEPEIIKVDRCLVHGISHNPALRRTTTRLLKCLEGLGAEVIAEGVENTTDSHVLQELGVPLVQGYLWGRPELMLE